MKTTFNVRKFALLAGAALLSTGAMAMPLTDSAVTKTEAVKYRVSDAASEAGAAALYQKLQAAAARVCAAGAADGLQYAAGSYESCVSDALDKAVLRVAIPMVSALHLQNAPSYAKLARIAKPEAKEKLTSAVASN